MIDPNANDHWPRDRAERINRMWKRAKALHEMAGLPLVDPGDARRRRAVLVCLAIWDMTGWRWENVLEPGDLGIEPESFTPRTPARRTSARPGTAEKLRVLAARIEAGCELWHPGDPVSPASFRAREGFAEV